QGFGCRQSNRSRRRTCQQFTTCNLRLLSHVFLPMICLGVLTIQFADDPGFGIAEVWVAISPPRAIGDVILALHFDQPRDRTLEPEGAVAGSVDFLGGSLRRGDQQGTRLVKRVDQDVETFGGVGLSGAEPRDPLDNDRRKALRDSEVVAGAERFLAELRKAEPG